MPLQGTQQALKSAAYSAAHGVLRRHQTAKLPEGATLPDDNLQALADAISEAMVVMLNHFLANNEVAAGIPVVTSGSASSQAGATTSNGRVI